MEQLPYSTLVPGEVAHWELFIDQNDNNVQTRDGHNSEQDKKRNETSVIGREERKKKQERIWYFNELLRSVFLKEFGSSPSTPNKQ